MKILNKLFFIVLIAFHVENIQAALVVTGGKIETLANLLPSFTDSFQNMSIEGALVTDTVILNNSTTQYQSVSRVNKIIVQTDVPNPYQRGEFLPDVAPLPPSVESLTYAEGTLDVSDREINFNTLVSNDFTYHFPYGSTSAGMDLILNFKVTSSASYLFDGQVKVGKNGIFAFAKLFDSEENILIDMFCVYGACDSTLIDLEPGQYKITINHAAVGGLGAGDVTGIGFSFANTSPVPLPSSAWLFVSGVIGLMSHLKRKI